VKEESGSVELAVNLSSTWLLDVMSDTPLTVDMHIGEVPETSAAPERVLLGYVAQI
jgi:hypothetical protein